MQNNLIDLLNGHVPLPVCRYDDVPWLEDCINITESTSKVNAAISTANANDIDKNASMGT